MAKHYNLVIIGTGTAATKVAMKMHAAGWRIAVIDFRPFGGTCALRGCDPKKVFYSAATAADHARRMYGKTLTGNIHIDWSSLLRFKRGFTDPVPQTAENNFHEKGIDTYHGRAHFIGPGVLEVGGNRLQGEYILIATGAEPRKWGIPGEEYLITNEEFLALEELPRRIVMVGGGYIAAEFSHIAARAGAQVTILQHGERMLNHFDPDLVHMLMKAFRSQDIEVRTGTTVEAIEKHGSSLCVHAVSSGEHRLSFDADLALHAAGRVPALDGLDLDVAGISNKNGRLELNKYLQSVTSPAVYAAGDAAQAGPPLTPVASHDADVVAANLLKGNHRVPDYTAVPSVAFTIPPIAAVGLSEKEAQGKALEFRIQTGEADDWFTARQSAAHSYGYKVLIDKHNDRVLGAHLVGPHAEEVINLFAFAIRHNITATDLGSMIFVYPTSSSDIQYML